MSSQAFLPSLETGRLLLRQFMPGDLDEYATRIFANPQVTRYLPASTLSPQERAGRLLRYIADHWQKRDFGLWAVTDRADGQFIGQAGLNYLVENGEVEVDYALAQPFWGRGIATEAAGAALRFGFEQLKLERIIGLVVPENRASRRVLEHHGMVFECNVHYFGLDLVQYAIEKARYQPAEGAYRMIGGLSGS